MKKIRASDKVYITESKIPGAGRGVFAGQNIKKGEVIEICPTIEVSQDENTLVTYLFYFGKGKGRAFLALGCGSLYNHSYTPNAKYKIKSSINVMEFTAISDIRRGGEITVNYKGASKNQNPLWFE